MFVNQLNFYNNSTASWTFIDSNVLVLHSFLNWVYFLKLLVGLELLIYDFYMPLLPLLQHLTTILEEMGCECWNIRIKQSNSSSMYLNVTNTDCRDINVNVTARSQHWQHWLGIHLVVGFPRSALRQEIPTGHSKFFLTFLEDQSGLTRGLARPILRHPQHRSLSQIALIAAVPSNCFLLLVCQSGHGVAMLIIIQTWPSNQGRHCICILSFLI